MDDAYCGPAPTPGTALTAWNADPFAMALIVLLAGLHLWRGLSHRASLATGLFLFVVLFISPLCALTVALFSARVFHHLLLIAIAAPFLATAFAAPLSGSWLSRVPLAWLVAVHAATLWLWHVPDIYALGVASALPYWLMQASLLGTAVALWHRVLRSGESNGAIMLALLATIVQMGMLGALLTFAREPLYEPHFVTTLPFGMTALQDQQLAGLIMWVPAAVPYLLAALWRLTAMLDTSASRLSGDRWSG